MPSVQFSSNWRDIWTSPQWALAVELEDRLLSLRQHGGSSGPVDRKLAHHRAERWRAQPPFIDNPSLWQRRLAADDLTGDELETLLGEAPESVRARHEELPWLKELREAYVAEVAEPFPWPSHTEEARQRSPFLPLVEPLIRRAHARLISATRRLCERCPQAPFEPDSAVGALLGHLPASLTILLGRTLVVELHAARMDGRLEGNTTEERFASFARMLYHREVALELLLAYPLLARRLVERVGQWEQNGLELLERLATDIHPIRQQLAGGEEIGTLVEITGGISDPHRGGRGVHLLRFVKGPGPSSFRLVYKPRSVTVEAAFQKLLMWLNARGAEPALRTIEVLDQGIYGWLEHVSAAPCPDAAALRRFFLRQGAFVALSYLLDGTDLHHENLIAAGEHPVLIDLETLFHPWVEGASLGVVEKQPGAALASTVMRSGLLPQRVWGGEGSPGIDLSGLGARTGEQLSPQAVLAVSARSTEEMRYERQRVEMAIDNRPVLAGDGGEVSVLAHADALEEGFCNLYHLLLAHREMLLSDDEGNPLLAFAAVETRVVFRATATYGTLSFGSTHPHCHANALEQCFFLDRVWSGVDQRPFLLSLARAEARDLSRGDIPYFSTRPGSRDLWDRDGRRLAHFFAETGLDLVRRRLDRFGPDDLERQRSILVAALDTVRLAEEDLPTPFYVFQKRPEPATRDELLAAAAAVGKRLQQIAFENEVEAAWLGVVHGEAEGWSVVPTGPDFYLGLPGIAVFLAYLGAVTHEPSFTAVARQAMRRQAHQLAERQAVKLPGIGAFNGWGGLIYAHTHLAFLWDDEAQLDAAERFLEGLLPQIDQDEHFDVIAGSAGLALALLNLSAGRPSALLGQIARACGEHLLANAEVQDRGGIGWRLKLAGDRALAGFSHGAAGISLALLRLGAVTGDERFRHAALQGIAYERTLFDAVERNWPDLRVAEPATDGDDAERFMTGWCHGAPGIGLARLAGLPLLDDTNVQGEIEIALETTLARGFGRNHCLCHGDLGNLDFVLEAALTFDDAALRRRAYCLAGGILDSLATDGRLFGLPGSIETPGLMVGLAGVGYGLLRLADPDRVPSLLALEPPGSDRASRQRLLSLATLSGHQKLMVSMFSTPTT